MDLAEAVRAHLQWEVKLRSVLDGKHTQTLIADDVAKDDLCELGKWLRTQEPKLKGNVVYEDLRIKHVRFHALAAQVLRKAQGGDIAGANALFKGDYSSCSTAVITATRACEKSYLGG
jgi:hypothetical protein